MASRRMRPRSWAFVARVALCAPIWWLLAPAPAWAWGPLAQGVIMERALAAATPKAPWLAAQREAVLWGAFASGVRWLPQGRALGADLVGGEGLRLALQKAAERDGRSAQGFAAGWAAAAAAEGVLAQRWPGGAAGRWLDGLPADRRALGLDWALDQAVVGQASPHLHAWAVATFWHAAGPGGLLASPVAQASGLPLQLWAQWGQILVTGLANGPEATLQGLQSLANWPGLGAEVGRSPAVRQALGDGPGPLAPAAEAASKALLALALTHHDGQASGPALAPPAPPRPAPSGPPNRP